MITLHFAYEAKPSARIPKSLCRYGIAVCGNIVDYHLREPGVHNKPQVTDLYWFIHEDDPCPYGTETFTFETNQRPGKEAMANVEPCPQCQAILALARLQ